MNGREVIGAIAMGELDANIDELQRAITARQKIVRTNRAETITASVKKGDRVRLTGISPKGLNGATGTVQSVTRSRVHVVIDKEFAGVSGRFGASIGFGMPLGVPAACIAEVLPQ